MKKRKFPFPRKANLLAAGVHDSIHEVGKAVLVSLLPINLVVGLEIVVVVVLVEETIHLLVEESLTNIIALLRAVGADLLAHFDVAWHVAVPF